MKKLVCLFLAGLLTFGTGASALAEIAPEEETVANSIEDIYPYSDGAVNSIDNFIGVNFINPQYGFNGQNCILEAGARLEELGTKSVKFYLSPNYKTYYEPNMTWADYSSPTQLVQDPSFDALIRMDFNTLFIGAYTFTENLYATYWFNSLTDEQKQNEYQAMYDLTYYLCTTYQNTGKTFILQNWEGDWSTMAAPNPATDPSDEVLARMTEWINIRQDAVNDARAAANAPGVRVYHALEVNLVDKAVSGGKTVTNNVIPNTYCDYYSYSAYDTEMDPEKFGAALDYLKLKASQNRNGGKSRVYVGEFGLPQNEFGTRKVLQTIQDVTEISREKGIDYVLFWQLYDDGVYDLTIPKSQQTDENCRGYWMVRPSGSKTAAWNYFFEKIHGYSDPEYVPEENPSYSSLEITLGETNEEHGIRQLDLADGMTTFNTIQGVPCRLSPGGAGNPYYYYMYFDADDDFISPEERELTIELTYYDQGTSPLYLQYFNAQGALKDLPITRANTCLWKTETIRLTDAKFDDLLQGVSDFRLSDMGDPVAVSKVKIRKGADTSGEIRLGGPSYVLSESGIHFIPQAGLVAVTSGTFADRQCISVPAGNHLWFDIDQSVVGPEDREMTVEVEYFDNQTEGGFVLYYTDGSESIVKPSQAVMFTGDNTWKTYQFTVTDAVINDLWYGDRDISFLSNAATVWVSSVKVSRPQAERSEISIVLRDPPLEDGIVLHTFQYDGSAIAVEKGGKVCLATDAQSNTSQDPIHNNLYFDADDLFIPSTQTELYLSITYFDKGTDDFQLQYNSTRQDDDPDWPGIATPLTLQRTGTDQWKTETIHLTDAQFQNKLQGLADFRLCDLGSQLFVSKIAIAKEAAN